MILAGPVTSATVWSERLCEAFFFCPFACSARLLDRPVPSLPPQLLGVDDRVNLTFLPSLLLISHGLERAMVARAERHGPLVAYLAAFGPRGAPADQAGGAYDAMRAFGVSHSALECAYFY